MLIDRKQHTIWK